MGSFNSLEVSCPKCGKKIEFYSKAGSCGLETHNADRVPIADAGALRGQSKGCDCGARVMLRCKGSVKMKVVVVE